jgi:hypothetical protein
MVLLIQYKTVQSYTPPEHKNFSIEADPAMQVRTDAIRSSGTFSPDGIRVETRDTLPCEIIAYRFVTGLIPDLSADMDRAYLWNGSGHPYLMVKGYHGETDQVQGRCGSPQVCLKERKPRDPS